ncbi:PEP-CTERM sorting domain-containing protein [Lacipirellula limnantheis]|uniref:Ice-binding protein C-terminal domain-containing protein n=1 Tax=Lacipirellula limnantheis TaxID=2528024 RepID=A0A517U5Q7_9BACT|nr:PEP-CTERM sorting domain-containing protein [Lacipirellula limnantheis]QDT75966.1 hypothetical protein I41_52110 [Lacipirellula limnantheis]
MSARKIQLTCLMALAAIVVSSATAQAAFDDFIIRNSGGGNPPVIQPNGIVPGALEFIIAEGGQKAGWGTDDISGYQIGQITNVGITRYDDTARFTAGSGPAVAPYFNIWVTDGMGKYAVLANEPSNPSFQPLFVDNGDGSKSYSLSFADIASEPVKVYETPNGGGNSTTTWVHDMFGNVPLTFGDVASLVIQAPSAAYIANPVNAVGSGAPDEIVTNAALGFNWIFGDTLSNYQSGMPGYVVGNPIAQAIPEPATLALAGCAALGLFVVRHRRLSV